MVNIFKLWEINSVNFKSFCQQNALKNLNEKASSYNFHTPLVLTQAVKEISRQYLYPHYTLLGQCWLNLPLLAEPVLRMLTRQRLTCRQTLAGPNKTGSLCLSHFSQDISIVIENDYMLLMGPFHPEGRFSIIFQLHYMCHEFIKMQICLYAVSKKNQHIMG